jgi:hypothetical protein
MSQRPASFRPLRRLTWLAVLVVLPMGCIKDWASRLRGPGFDEGTRRFTSEIPERANEGKPFSFSTKAQEIEGNFGFQ